MGVGVGIDVAVDVVVDVAVGVVVGVRLTGGRVNESEWPGPEPSGLYLYKAAFENTVRRGP